MKMKAKILVVIAGLMCIAPLFACYRIEYGLVIGKGNERNAVYYASTISEEQLKKNGYTKEQYLQKEKEEANELGYTGWQEVEAIDMTDSDGNHYIGTRYTDRMKNKDTAEYLTKLMLDNADMVYTDTNLFGKRTISVTMTPRGGNFSGIYGNSANNNKYQEYYDHYFAITVPGQILETNGAVKNDGYTAEWDIDSIIEGDSGYINMQVTFQDNSFFIPIIVIGIIVILVIIAGVVFVIMRKKAQKEFDNGGAIKMASTSQINGEGKTGIKCPACGYDLREDDTFCVNCGEVL